MAAPAYGTPMAATQSYAAPQFASGSVSLPAGFGGSLAAPAPVPYVPDEVRCEVSTYNNNS